MADASTDHRASLGTSDGAGVSYVVPDGAAVGTSVGNKDGALVGGKVGTPVGPSLGLFDGTCV